MAKAWDSLPFARDSIGLVEAHGTGTPAGDDAELETMGQFFGAYSGTLPRPVIGSVKSMIGHAMPAAGIAGLIKSALAVYHGILPPSLHCDVPHARLEATRFRVLARSERWVAPRHDRIAAVNAFGFGGINAHVVLRGATERSGTASVVTGVNPLLPLCEAVLTLSASTPAELLARLANGERDATPVRATCRLVIIAPDEKKLALAHKVIAAGKPWRGRQQIYFSAAGLLAAGGKTVFLFPGVDSTFAPQAGDLAAHFALPLPQHCEPLDPQQSLLKVVLGLLGFNRFMYDILTRLGLRADAMAGHSIGEWSAMLAAGMMDQGLSDRTNATLDLDAMKFPDVQFLAAAASEDTLLAAMAGLADITVSHDNCPHQVIACGAQGSIAVLAERLRAGSVFTQLLPIVSGFHSPLFSSHMKWYRDFFGAADLVEPQIPVWSATTASPFPAGMSQKRALALDHLLQPVRFRTLIESLYNMGHRVFVQVGTGSLTGFVNDTLHDLPHLALQTHQEGRTGMAQLINVCAALWVEGAEFDTRLLVNPSNSSPAAAGAHVATPEPAHTLTLSLGVPLLRIRTPLEFSLPDTGVTASSSSASPTDDPVQMLMQATLADIEQAGRDVMELWHRHVPPRLPQLTSRVEPAPAQPLSSSASRTLHPPLDCRIRLRLDINTTIRCVADHCLYPQLADWPVMADRHPVVPLTMEVMLVREAVQDALPGMKVIEVRNIQAYNWLAVAQPLDVEIRLYADGSGVVETTIDGYFKAEVVIAGNWPAPDIAPVPALQNSRDTAVAATDLYHDHWMFHGPAYQGVVRFRGIGENGIDGDVRVPDGKGALLDNMGQLAGYWVMEQPDNCLAMPLSVNRIRFFGADPAPGDELHNQVRVGALDSLNCTTDHVLTDAHGAVRVVINGWHTRRYQMDKAFWLNSRQLGNHGVSQRLATDITLFEDNYDTAILRDYMAQRYLTAPEMTVYAELPPRRRRNWLNGRVAAKDAVRGFLRDTCAGKRIWPKELRIENEASGLPRIKANVTSSVPEALSVSIAHKDRMALAIVGEHAVGIDVERIEVRDESFNALVFTQDERELLEDEEPAIALTRGWVAKEAVGKALGTGLGGQWQALVIEAREGDRLRVNGHWVTTRQIHNYIAGWTGNTGTAASVPPDAPVHAGLPARRTQGQLTGAIVE